jgi:ATP synthase protein I
MADKDPRNPLEPRGTSVSVYAGLGIQFVTALLLFLFLGQWADKKLGTAPWLMIAGVFLGAGAAFYSMYRRLMADLEREERSKREKKE